VTLAIWSLIRSKKHRPTSGGSGCSGNCASCGSGCPYCKK
jgi:hypothetical protein